MEERIEVALPRLTPDPSLPKEEAGIRCVYVRST